MATTNPMPMSSYELPLPAGGPSPAPAASSETFVYFPESLLVGNAAWFCRLRWIVIAILSAFGLLSLVPGLFARMGLRPQPVWPFAVAVVLSVANLGFLAHARRHARAAAPNGGKANLWAQILVDLAVLTVVVHYLGSLETNVAFAYLFHIVLACIFFPRAPSFAITAIACGLYTSCVGLEEAGVLAPAGIYADSTLRNLIDRTPAAWLVNVGWALLTWTVVSYLTAHLSDLVRKRDSDLAATNRRLVDAQNERTQHMLRTTHELKAPFSAIHANVQLLLKGFCGPITDPMRDVLQRMAARCGRLATEIKEMLQLANLESRTQAPLHYAELDVADVLRSCVAQMRPMAEARDVVIDEHLRPALTVAAEDHLRMLFTNLLANAVNYSRPGGHVLVECMPGFDGDPQVTIADQGIGIPPDKLSRIFDPYYRTAEAVRHNKESTGLGLAIVREVAEATGIRVRVESAPNVGTRFTLKLRPAEQGPP